MPGDFDYLYLDTEVLWKAHWPKESTELEVLLFLAQLLGVTVVISKGSDVERRRQWVDDIQKQISRWKTLNSLWDELNISVGRSHLWIRDEKQLETTYDELAERLKRRWSILTVPLAKRDSDLLFDLAVNKRGAFEESGKGLQDTLIYMSAIEHLQSVLPRKGAFVSADKNFQNSAIQELTRSEGVEIEVFESISLVIERLRKRLADDPKRRWEFDIHTADQSLRKHIPILKKFVLEELTPRAGEFVGPDDQGHLDEVNVIRISNVQTPPLNGRAAGQRVRLSFDLSVRVRVWSLSSKITERERIVEVDIEAEADALWTGDGYEQISPVGKLSSQMDAISEGLAAFRNISCSVRSNELVVRSEGYSELLGEVRLELSGMVPPHGDLVHVDIRVILDTFASGRLDADGFSDATLRSDRRGSLAKGRIRNTNSVVFEAVPLGPGGERIEETWIISGLRGDASTKGVFEPGDVSIIGAVVEMVTADPFRPRAALVRKEINLAVVQLAKMPRKELCLIPTPENSLLGGEDRTYSFVVQFEPQFPGLSKPNAKRAARVSVQPIVELSV